MDILTITAVLVFVFSYLLITLEHKIRLNKSAVALFTAGFLWLITAIAVRSKETLSHALEIAGADIFNIVIFLLAAMTLVEILIHYNFFDLIRLRLLKMRLNDKKQFFVIGTLTFFLSALLDNLTISIVMTQIARRFFKNENLLVAAAGIVVLSNAGGAWSPIGDVTTIMIWLADKFSAMEVIIYGFLPSFVLGAIALVMLGNQIKGVSTDDKTETRDVKLTRGEKLIISMTLVSFMLPLVMNYFGLQPYIGLLFGLGIVWILIEYAQIRSLVKTHLEGDIDKLVKKVDIGSLKFFIGILLSVAALNTLGVLESISELLFGANQETSRLIIGNVILGLLSAIVDNVPLTAIAIDIIKTTDPNMWVLLAITAGTGGSLLLIGSVAGVIVMGMIKELNFAKYFKIAFMPALVGYVAAVAVWGAQYYLLLN